MERSCEQTHFTLNLIITTTIYLCPWGELHCLHPHLAGSLLPLPLALVHFYHLSISRVAGMCIGPRCARAHVRDTNKIASHSSKHQLVELLVVKNSTGAHFDFIVDLQSSCNNSPVQICHFRDLRGINSGGSVRVGEKAESY